MAFNQSFEIAGLTSIDTAVPTAGVYVVSGKLQIPRLASGSTGVSAAVVTITNRTGPVTLYTGTAGADGFETTALCAAADVIRVAITSANAADQDVNAVKTQVGISSGVS